MQVLISCLLILAVENVKLVQNERSDDVREVLDSTQFKNAVAKELLKKKLSNLAAARQQDSLALFLKKGGKNLSGLKTAPKSNFNKDDDPSRKQSQMANTFIASSNLLFGTKSQQRKACQAGGKNKEGLDMRSMRQACSGYSEDRSDFSASKDAPKLPLDTLNDSISVPLQKRSNPKSLPDPISCYLTEPKKITCTHKDVIYKIALPSSEVGDDEIGRIVESIYRTVEGESGKASLDEPIEGVEKTSLKDSADATGSKKASAEDSSKKKRASEDYLRSVFLNNLLVANHNIPNYNSNNPVFIPLLIPMTQPKIDPLKAPAGYYSGMAIDPRLQIPMNLSVGVDPVNYQAGRNMFENSYGQYLVPNGFAMPELNLKQRSQVNLTAEAEKRRNWLALMATNGLVPVENGVNSKLLTQHSANEVQSISEEKDSHLSGNKLTVAETGEVLDKLLNKRQQRDTYFLKRQMRRRPIAEEQPRLEQFNGDGRKHMLTKVVQKLSDPGGYLLEEKKGCPCPCPSDVPKGLRKPAEYSPKYPSNKFNFFQTTTIQSNDVKCCSSTAKCPTTFVPQRRKCSTCPEGCQPIPSCPCNSTSCKPKSDMFEDSDILSRAVSGRNKGKEERWPSIHSHQNWLPYSPQFIPQNQPQYPGQSNQFDQKPASPKDQDSQQSYYASGNRGNERQSINNNKSSKMSMPMIDDHQPSLQFDNSGQFQEQDQYSGPTEPQDQLQFSGQTNLVRNHIQVNYKQPPFDDRVNVNGAKNTVNETGFKMDELQNKTISQAQQNNASEAKTKKHRDSFFARLRSKFHKGIPPNGTDLNQYNHQSQNIQNKAVFFKFTPRNQTSGKDNSTATTNPTTNNQQCFENQSNQSNDQTLTLTNQTQPSTVNNINITIQSMQPGQGQVQVNQTNQTQESSKNVFTNKISPTCRPVSSGQNGRTCKVTKIWLCPQSTNMTCTQPTCQTKECTTTPSSTIQTTQTTCQTTSTCTTSPPTYQSTMSNTSPSTQLSTCEPLQYPQEPYDSEGADTTQPSMCSTDTSTSICTNTQSDTCGSDMPPGSSPLPENPWSPGDNQMPDTPRPSDTGSPSKIKPFNYRPYPAWNQWRNPVDRINVHSPDRNFNWQQQTRVPLPTLFAPQVPQRLVQDPKVPLTTPAVPQGPYQQGEHLSLLPPSRQRPPGQQRLAQQQHGPGWQQAPSRQLLDPRWQEVQPNFPNPGPNSKTGQPNEFQYPQQISPKRSESNKTTASDKMRGIRKVHLPANIKQHIARVRRYLLKKRSQLSKKSLTISP